LAAAEEPLPVTEETVDAAEAALWVLPDPVEEDTAPEPVLAVLLLALEESDPLPVPEVPANVMRSEPGFWVRISSVSPPSFFATMRV
jgi:hypothetical protein